MAAGFCSCRLRRGRLAASSDRQGRVAAAAVLVQSLCMRLPWGGRVRQVGRGWAGLVGVRWWWTGRWWGVGAGGMVGGIR